MQPQCYSWWFCFSLFFITKKTSGWIVTHKRVWNWGSKIGVRSTSVFKLWEPESHMGETHKKSPERISLVSFISMIQHFKCKRLLAIELFIWCKSLRLTYVWKGQAMNLSPGLNYLLRASDKTCTRYFLKICMKGTWTPNVHKNKKKPQTAGKNTSKAV